MGRAIPRSAFRTPRQSNSELTDWLLCLYPIAFPINPAIESTFSFSNCRSSGIRIGVRDRHFVNQRVA